MGTRILCTSSGRARFAAWGVAALAVAMLMQACGGGGGADTQAPPPGTVPSPAPAPAPPPTVFTVDEAFAASLQARGLDAEASRFFAAAQWQTPAAVAGVQHYLQTFSNGATRDISIRFGAAQSYAPTAAELAAVQAGRSGPAAQAVYAVVFAQVALADSAQTEATQTDLQYFVPFDAMPPELKAQLQARPAATGGKAALARRVGPLAAGDATDGVTVYIQEIAKKGADAGIGKLLEYATDHGLPAGALGNLFAMASALSDISSAVDLAQQNKAWQRDLAGLRGCAANPTNPLAKTDPQYAARTQAKIDALSGEMKVVSAVRFLNMLTETASGVSPGLAIALKAGFTWSERALQQYSTDTIMKEAGDAVVACSYPMQAQFAYSFSNAYNLCNTICYDHQQQWAASASFVVEVTFADGYGSALLAVGSIAKTESFTLSDGRQLNPPYTLSRSLTFEGQPLLESAGGPMTPPDGVSLQDFEALHHGKRYLDVTAMSKAEDLAHLVLVTVENLNNAPITRTLNQMIEDGTRVVCRFEDIDPTLGGSYTGTVLTGGVPSNPGAAPGAAGACKVTLAPIK